MSMIRLFDIFFAGLAIICLSPLLLLVVVTLLLTGERKVFYLQQRVGLGGKSFFLLKFATMLENSPNLGSGTITIRNDYRVLPVGRVLRKTKANELPQLINVLTGDMSLIGPRPLTRDNYDFYNSQTKEIIAQVRPGLSGIGSILLHDEESIISDKENPREFYKINIAPFKGLLEKWYVHNNSLGLYFKLITATIFVVILKRTTFIYRLFPTLPPMPDALDIGRDDDL